MRLTKKCNMNATCLYCTVRINRKIYCKIHEANKNIEPLHKSNTQILLTSHSNFKGKKNKKIVFRLFKKTLSDKTKLTKQIKQ